MFPSETRAFLEQESDDGGGQDVDDNLVLAILPNTIKGMVSSRSFEGIDCVRKCLVAHLHLHWGALCAAPPATYRARVESVG
jgi:hypothetical protein